MISSAPIIAIDGYSSTGKSTFAKKIADRYGLLYLDSGALYRAVTLAAMENGLIRGGMLDKKGLPGFLDGLDVHFGSIDGRCVTFIGERNVEKEIRSMAVSDNVSRIAAEKEVRRFVDDILHKYSRDGGVIMDGRDIGTTVFPNADVKIFMTADPDIRAQRRLAELAGKGVQTTIEEVKRNLTARDWDDSHRAASPLIKAPDAIVLDNTAMTFEDQMEWIDKILKREK